MDSVVTLQSKRKNLGQIPDNLSSLNEEQLETLSGNPAFERFIQKRVARDREFEAAKTTPKKGNRNPGITSGNHVVKSPSDTTIYAPALQLIDRLQRPQAILPNILGQQSVPNSPNVISFVGQRSPDGIDTDKTGKTGGKRAELTLDEQLQDKASKLILEAEQHKASVQAPKGIEGNEFFADNVKEDDEFFHITCHVDPVLIAAIQKGQFVDLEKLLPKLKGGLQTNEPKTKMVFQDGHPFFMPVVDKSRVINNFKKLGECLQGLCCNIQPGKS